MQKDDEDTLVDYIGLNAKSAKSQCILFGFVFLALVVFNAIVFIKLWPKNLNEIPAGRVADDDLYISNMPCPSGKFEDEEKAIRRYETLEKAAKEAATKEKPWSPSYGTSSSKYLKGQARDVLANELGILEPPTGDTAKEKAENIRDKRAEDLARSFGLTDAQIAAAKAVKNLREIVSYGERGVDVRGLTPNNAIDTTNLLKARLAAKEAGKSYTSTATADQLANLINAIQPQARKRVRAMEELNIARQNADKLTSGPEKDVAHAEANMKANLAIIAHYENEISKAQRSGNLNDQNRNIVELETRKVRLKANEQALRQAQEELIRDKEAKSKGFPNYKAMITDQANREKIIREQTEIERKNKTTIYNTAVKIIQDANTNPNFLSDPDTSTRYKEALRIVGFSKSK